MPKTKPLFEQVSIVIVGDFNPRIINPDWLLSNSLISKGDFNTISVELINNEFSIFSTRQIKLTITRQKFQVMSLTTSFPEVIRDLVIGIFSILNHTPISQLGINNTAQFKLKSDESRNIIGFKLVKKENWTKLFSNYEGMKTLVITSKRSDDFEGKFNFKIEPSNIDKDVIITALNSDFIITKGCSEIPKILENWDREFKIFSDTSQAIIALEGKNE